MTVTTHEVAQSATGLLRSRAYSRLLLPAQLDSRGGLYLLTPESEKNRRYFGNSTVALAAGFILPLILADTGNKTEPK